MPRRIANRGAKRRTRKTYGKRKSVRRRKYATTTRIAKKRILDIASTKKHDTMGLAIATGGVWALTNSAIPGDNNVHSMVWCPTARHLDPDENQRNRTTVYYKGISDRFMLSTTDVSVWLWRRLVVSSATVYGGGAYQNTNTYFRNGTVDDPIVNGLLEDLFSGTKTVDWTEPFTAKTTSQRFRIHSDRFRYIRPQGINGDIRMHKHYYPLNHNLQYADEEIKGGRASSDVAATTMGNLGNVYIVDLFKCNRVNAPSLLIQGDATVYWHEK